MGRYWGGGGDAQAPLPPLGLHIYNTANANIDNALHILCLVNYCLTNIALTVAASHRSST